MSASGTRQRGASDVLDELAGAIAELMPLLTLDQRATIAAAFASATGTRGAA